MLIVLEKAAKVNNVFRSKGAVLDVPLVQARALVFSKVAKTVTPADQDAVTTAGPVEETPVEVAPEVTETVTESDNSDVQPV